MRVSGFEQETLVLTQKGYKYISEIAIGDFVLTHKNRWRKVIDLIQFFINKTLVVKVTGSTEIKTTFFQPFLTSRKVYGKKRQRLKTENAWKKAEDLQYDDLICGGLPPTEKIDISNENLWLMGLYTADGHLRFRNNNFEGVFFSIGLHQQEAFEKKIKRKFSSVIMNSVCRICMYGKDFCKSFEQFGRAAHLKSLPNWVLCLPKDQAQCFLDGYLFGDGYINNKVTSSNSVSKKLSLSISLLMRRCFNKGSRIFHCKRKNTKCVIEGRIVNQRDQWICICSNSIKGVHYFIDNDYIWNRFGSKEENGSYIMYNLSVEEDESYMVDQCFVYN